MKVPGLVICDIDVPFGDLPGLHGLSLAVARGERVAVVGASGAGKTSLLRAIAGLTPVQRGSITIGDRDVTRAPPERRGAVYLHQAPVLFPHLSVADNVAFPLRLRRRPERETRERVDRLLAAVGLADLGHRAPRTLSGGQRHRIALARAVAAEPDVLLLDEPLSALDPALRDEVRRALLTLQAEYAPALVLVTHDLDEAALIADRVAVLLDGRFAQVASPADLFRRPASLAVARFLGIRNEIAGRVTPEGGLECEIGRFPLPQSVVADGEVVALFSPDAVELTPSAEGNGRVVEIRHRVHASTILVSLAGVIVEASAPASSSLSPGDRVQVQIRSERLIVLPRKGGEDPG